MKIIENYNLILNNSYRVNSICRTAIFPTCEEEIVEVFEKYKDIVLIGSGHNVILSKSYYDNTFVIIDENYSNIKIVDTELEIEAGARMEVASVLARDNELTGLEVFYDIPSSLGGAVVMNAGAFGLEIKDVLQKVRYLDLEDFKIKDKCVDQIDFEYRNSFFQKNKNVVILRAWLQLMHGDYNDINEKMEDLKNARWLKQPKDFPNAGSVFKRPKGYYVGAIVDELNLKGLQIGGAKISEKHGGFIINCGDATGQDIVDLIKLINSRVLQSYGFELEVEQRII